MKYLAQILATTICLGCSGDGNTSHDSSTLPPRVLLIGIDGLRPDALLAAPTPNLDKLMSAGAFNPNAQTCAKTVSGPSWMSILTGAWPDTHGVLDNSFANYNLNAKHFLKRIEEHDPSLRTASITEWSPLAEHAHSGADLILSPGSTPEVATAAIKEVNENEPDALFLHFDEVDHAGHSVGYGPDIPEYLSAIELVDEQIGLVLEHINLNEWLVLATTDHGGTGTGHGQDIPLHRTVFLLAAGDYKGGPMRWRRYAEVTDIVPTILRHFEIPIQENWQLVGASLGMSAPSTPNPAQFADNSTAEAFQQSFTGSPVTLEMLPIDGGKFWMSKTEISWDVFDLFFLRETEEIDADGISGPSKSVFPVDRGFGHDGHPALGMTINSARHFCEWLSHETGRVYRLPTESEWMLVATEAKHAWTAENSGGKPHACAESPAESNGLHDILGNVAEWIESDQKKGVACGGSYLDSEVSPNTRATYDLSWQARDSQWPKSSWWMSDCGWVGIRIVCEKP